jgi:phosphotransacetylase
MLQLIDPGASIVTTNMMMTKRGPILLDTAINIDPSADDLLLS